MGILQPPADKCARLRGVGGRSAVCAAPMAGTRCPECGNFDRDPQGWLRVLHRVRLHRSVWLRFARPSQPSLPPIETLVA
jgi:hypothetical protein